MKVTLDLPQEARILGCEPMRTPINANIDLWDESKPLLEDVSQYMRLVGKLIYLTFTRLDITYDVRLMSQFMHKPKEVH